MLFWGPDFNLPYPGVELLLLFTWITINTLTPVYLPVFAVLVLALFLIIQIRNISHWVLQFRKCL